MKSLDYKTVTKYRFWKTLTLNWSEMKKLFEQWKSYAHVNHMSVFCFINVKPYLLIKLVSKLVSCSALATSTNRGFGCLKASTSRLGVSYLVLVIWYEPVDVAEIWL